VTAMLLSMLILSQQPACGAQVVAITAGEVLVLYGRDGAPAARIIARNRRLPVALPVTQCGQVKVLVRYQGQSLIAERWQLVYDQPLDICAARVSGSREGSLTLGEMRALDECRKKRRGGQ
jgi:hypothetical protein